MFFRVVRTKVREGAVWRFREYYEERVLPALELTEGCLYAALLCPTGESAAGGLDSLTLWESTAHADAYVSSGLYDDILDGADPYLAAAATGWKADLSRPLSGQRPPLPDPEVDTFPVEVARATEGGAEGPALYLRIVDHRVEPSRFHELKKTYEEEVAPALLDVPGCLATYLVEGLRGKSQALSVTFWHDEASALRYESSGRFDALANLLAPFLSGLYQWRLSLAPAGEERGLEGSDLSVSGLQIVAGRRLGSPGA